MGKELLSLLLVVFYTAFIYLFLILILSVFGRRQISELGVTELVVVAVLGSAVETSLVGGDKSLLAGLVSVTTLLLVNRALTVLMQRWDWLGRRIVGRPVPLIYNGQMLSRRIHQVGLTEEDVMEGIRQRGYEKAAQVRLAMLELDGDISVVPIEKSAKKQ